MTEAYIAGFCKTAEEHGVDPKALLKAGGVRGDISLKGLNRLIRNPGLADLTSTVKPLPQQGKLLWPLSFSGIRTAAKGYKAKRLADLLVQRGDTVPNATLIRNLLERSRVYGTHPELYFNGRKANWRLNEIKEQAIRLGQPTTVKLPK